MIALLAALWSLGALPTPEALPACGPEVTYCAPVRLFVAAEPEGDGADLASFLEAQLREANRLHGLAELGFRVTAIERLPAGSEQILTRAQRDELGHERWRQGVIDVYVVARLSDVDAPMGSEAQIRGVHWRSRQDRERRFIILSLISPEKVLAHELGHYFGLPHSAYPESIMNKRPRTKPPPEARTFAPSEVRKIRATAKRLFASQALTDAR